MEPVRKLGSLLGLALVAAAVPALSQAPVVPPAVVGGAMNALDTKTASIDLWRFAKCAVVASPAKVKPLLDRKPWRWLSGYDASNEKLLAAVPCASVAGKADLSHMRLDGRALDGALAGAWLARKYPRRALPNFAKVPRIFSAEAINAVRDPADRAQHLLLSLAECVVRNDGGRVGQLIALEPFSDAETALYGQLQPMLGACMPTDPGAQLRFSRLQLRNLLAEAAYEVDSAARAGGGRRR